MNTTAKLPIIDERVAEALTTNPPVSELVELQAELAAAVVEVGQRVAVIKPGKPGFEGPERRKVLLSGSTEDLQAIDAEFNRLSSRLQLLQARQRALHQHVQAARAREAVEGLPAQYDALDEAIAEVEQAGMAFREKLERANAVFIAIRESRMAARQGGHAALPGTTRDLCARLATLRDIQPNRGLFVVAAPVSHLYEQLGATT